jgi:hypothetical protein
VNPTCGILVSEPERKQDRAVCPSTFRSVRSIARDLVISDTVLLPPLDVDTLLKSPSDVVSCEHGELLIRCQSVSSKKSPSSPTTFYRRVLATQSVCFRISPLVVSARTCRPWSHRLNRASYRETQLLTPSPFVSIHKNKGAL